tara:strand:+ start:2131 stop:2535 length:405 start_codon:yes stop_codon:yes gene_type:complete
MPIVTLTFDHAINTSAQVGDIAYYVYTSPVGTTQTWASTTTPHDSADREDIRKIGVIETINSTQSQSIVTVDMPNSLSSLYGPPANGDFIMFSKDNKVNLASLAGYYSSVKLRNNSKEHSELFSVNSDFTESSK